MKQMPLSFMFIFDEFEGSCGCFFHPKYKYNKYKY